MPKKPINSDLSVATARASALKKAASTLQQAVSVERDHQTTVRGNQKASQAIVSAHQTAQDIAKAINGASTQLQTVATNFEATDTEASRTLFGSLSKGLNQ